MLADYHVHTEFSDDSVYPMEKAVQDAISLGLDEICFTDHVDYGVKADPDGGEPIRYRGHLPLANVNYPAYMQKIQELRELYGRDIVIRTGMEFGMQVHTIPRYEALFRRYPFDFIILSVHQVEDREFWTQEFQRGRTQEEYNMRYYEEILALVQKYHHYSVLGHLDLIVRYDPAGVYPFENVRPIITDILKIVIRDGKGIEFNTSYLRYGLDDTTPSMEILKLYRDLGGTIITIGSDSHKREDLGSHVAEAQQILSGLGFGTFCTFERMKPVFHEMP